MGLFGKKKRRKKTCCCSAVTPDMVNGGGGCRVKVLGAGCKSCREQYEYVKKAVSNLGLSIEVEYITDMKKVTEYGVMSMPAIVVNDNVVAFGKVLKTAEVEKLLK